MLLLSMQNRPIKSKIAYLPSLYIDPLTLSMLRIFFLTKSINHEHESSPLHLLTYALTCVLLLSLCIHNQLDVFRRPFFPLLASSIFMLLQHSTLSARALYTTLHNSKGKGSPNYGSAQQASCSGRPSLWLRLDEYSFVLFTRACFYLVPC